MNNPVPTSDQNQNSRQDEGQHAGDEISRLLRLKRYEQPSPEYVEGFVRDFHRRQRAEMLRQPLWRIAMDRAGTFFGPPKWDWYGYAAATAAAVVLFLGVSNFDFRGQGTGAQASASIQPASAAPNAATAASVPAPGMEKQLPTNLQTASSESRTERPRYVIDTRPVSYPVNEPPFSF